MVIGLDISLTATGIARPEGSTLVLKTRARDADGRLDQIEQAVYREAQGCDLAVVEGPGRFLGKTGHLIGMAHGAARLALWRRGVPFVEVAPATLKRYATGNGSADKAAMTAAATAYTGIRFTDDPGGDQADAAWLRWAALDWYGQPEGYVPVEQRVWLDVVKWPGTKERKVA